MSKKLSKDVWIASLGNNKSRIILFDRNIEVKIAINMGAPIEMDPPIIAIKIRQ